MREILPPYNLHTIVPIQDNLPAMWWTIVNIILCGYVFF